MNQKGEFEMGLLGLAALLFAAGILYTAYDTHETTLIKLKALDKGCTPAQVEQVTK